MPGPETREQPDFLETAFTALALVDHADPAAVEASMTEYLDPLVRQVGRDLATLLFSGKPGKEEAEALIGRLVPVIDSPEYPEPVKGVLRTLVEVTAAYSDTIELIERRVGPETLVETYNLLRPQEVAKIFHVNSRTVAKWASEGKLEHIRTPGGHLRFSSRSVRRALEDANRATHTFGSTPTA